MRFLGREKELESLKLLLDKQSSSIVACRGRRRIGKSTLIREFARRNELAFVNIDGLAPHPKQTNRDQLVNFILKLSQQTRYAGPVPENWFAAFKALDASIDDSRWTVVLLDEISWMGRYDSDFAGYLKSAWDNDLKYHDRLILVVCGSVSSWINRNLLDKAEFGGRFSRDVLLRELPLDLCASFWGDKASVLPTREIVDVLAVTGGGPRYLEEVNPALSANENIKRMCFSRDGVLFGDFKAIFSQVFGEESVLKRNVLVSLMDGPRTCIEVAEALGVERGGSLSETLEVLVDAGFVTKDEGYNPETGKKARTVKYRLSDNYTRFYLKYIEPNLSLIARDTYRFASLDQLPDWEGILGLQFECLILNNVDLLLPLIGLDRALLISAAPYRQNKTERLKGCQIDLAIQTKKSVYCVEIKRQNSIGEKVVNECEEKISRLKMKKDRTVRPVLVYDGDLSRRVPADAFFSFIVSADRLIGRESDF